MDIETIKRKKSELIERYGQWTAHNIQLADGLYTIDNRLVGDEIKLRRILQIVSDIAAKPLEELRVLDLACLEGLYSIEFARHGAEVVAIEGRKANIEKARLAKEVLSLTNLELIQDDVRNLSVDRHGMFDVVLCLGVLYHLDVPDVFHFVENIAEVCGGFAIFDTHVSLTEERCHNYRGHKYGGKNYVEHSVDSTPEQREQALWASLDNTASFWFTKPSLCNLIARSGFSSVYECSAPSEMEKPEDRITLLAMRGEDVRLLSTPLVNVAFKEV